MATTTFESTSELLERASELARLADALSAVRSERQGRFAFVRGEAGVGKTSLVRRFCALAPETRVLWGGCEPLFTPRPLGPFLDIAETAGGELARATSGEPKPYELAAELLRELGGSRTTAVIVEDVHWADEATLDVLRLLARRIESVPALLVATYRDDELDRRHPLRGVLGELGRRALRIVVEPLSPTAVGELAASNTIDAEELYRKTNGNPFFVTEALAAGGAGVPETVRDAVLARAAPLTASAREVLDAVAVVPPRAQLWLLAELVPDALGSLEECLASGVLRAGSGYVEFRHELARLAIEDALPPTTRASLNGRALAAHAAHPTSGFDLARLAHHAEAAGDGEAVLRYAPAAAAQAESAGAFREAASQYARALRFGDSLPPAERAALLERRGDACGTAGENPEAVEMMLAARDIYRRLGENQKAGRALTSATYYLWCPGRVAESYAAIEEARALLEPERPTRKLGHVYDMLAFLSRAALDLEANERWVERLAAVAEETGDVQLRISVEAVRAEMAIMAGDAGGFDALDRARADAESKSLWIKARGIMMAGAYAAFATRSYAEADRRIADGLAHVHETGRELSRHELLAYRAITELERGRWTEAVETADEVLRVPRSSTWPLIHALMVVGLVRARRGDPDPWSPLDEASRLAWQSGELSRIARPTIARAEAAWLEGRGDEIEGLTEDALELARKLHAEWVIAALTDWRRRAGPEPAGDWRAAAEEWRKLGCPYETALALADADEEEPLREAHAELQRLGAVPAAAIVARRLHARGARGLPRGPRESTRRNPANLTGRELEVLDLLADGLRNAEIAERLVLSERTVHHHVSAVLRKLNVSSRAQAGAEARRLHLIS